MNSLEATSIEEDDLLLMNVLFQWDMDHCDERWIDTREAAVRLLGVLKLRGSSYALFLQEPWFGLEPSVRKLENRGFVACDPGMAQFVAPTAPTPIAKRYFLRISAKGKAFLNGLDPCQ